MYANYRTIAELIKNRKSFDGNSVSASETQDGYYYIKSYDTIIYAVTSDNDVKFDNSKYSVTTSKLQNLIIRALGLDIPCKRSL